MALWQTVYANIVGASVVPTSSLFDRSGTIAAGGVAQTLAAARATRQGLQIQNTSTGDLWINELGTAAATQPSIWLPPGAMYTAPYASTSTYSIFGATTGQAFNAREW